MERTEKALLTMAACALAVAAIVLSCDRANAQGTSVAGKRLANGNALLVAGIESPTPEGFSDVVQVCFRVEGGAELGCVSEFVAVADGAFQFEGQLHQISETLPPDAQNLNLVAVTSVVLPEAANVLARSVDADGDASERQEPIFFAPLPPPDHAPKAPILILLDELQGALERVREQLADAQ